MLSIQALPGKGLEEDNDYRQIHYIPPREPGFTDMSQKTYDPTSMAFYELFGGPACRGNWRCHGFVVTPHKGIMFGSMIIRWHRLIDEEIHQRMVQSVAEAEALAQYAVFLKDFAPARDSLMHMALIEPKTLHRLRPDLSLVVKSAIETYRSAAAHKRKRPVEDVGTASASSR